MPDTIVAPPNVVPGQLYRGIVTGLQPYGVFVRFDDHAGLCHRSNLPPDIPLESLSRRDVVLVEVLTVTDASRIALKLIKRISRREGDAGKVKMSGIVRKAAVAAETVRYGHQIGRSLSEGAKSINEMGRRYRNNPPPSRAGFVAEAAATADFNTDAAFKNAKARAHLMESNGLKSPDIVVTDGSGKVAQEVSSKVYRTADHTAEAQRGYGEQVRLVPKDQLDEVKRGSRQRAASERAKGKPNRDQVAIEQQQVADHATDHIEQDGVRSRPRTRKESQELGQKAKDGNVSGADISGDVGARALDGAKAGAKSGAIVSAGIATVAGVYGIYKAKDQGKDAILEASKQAAKDVAGAAVDGGVKGGVSGATTAAAQVLAQRTSSAALKRVLGSSAPAAVALTAVELAKHSIDYARGVKTVDQFKQAAGNTVLSNSATFIGAEIGFLIGGPIGALVGGLAAPILLSAGRSLFASSSDGAQIKDELGALLEQTSLHDGAAAYHAAQLAKMLDALAASSAVVLADRVVSAGSSYYASAEAVLVYGGRIYIADFKAWKGSLHFPEVMEQQTIVKKGLLWDSTEEIVVGTGRYDDKYVIQMKTDQYGLEHEKSHRNPSRSLRQFIWHLRERLAQTDSRWKSVSMMPIAVFPDGDVRLSEQMLATGEFMFFSDFLALLSAEEAKPTPRWILDGLSTTPTWDLLQDRAGTLHSGIIDTPAFPLLLTDGTVEIPFDAILKFEAGTERLERPGSTIVTLHDNSVIEGVLGDRHISLTRKGHKREFALRELSVVCPAYQILAAA